MGILECRLEDKVIKFEIWDTAGQGEPFFCDFFELICILHSELILVGPFVVDDVLDNRAIPFTGSNVLSKCSSRCCSLRYHQSCEFVSLSTAQESGLSDAEVGARTDIVITREGKSLGK